MSTHVNPPPTARDFEIYEAAHIAGCSTRSQALKHQISQTRVRQVIRRVVEWLGQVLPPQAKVAKEQETHLARQIAADRFQHQYEQATTFWNETSESKYAGLRLRITTAQARLGVVGGSLDGLAADAIEGIPVPAWQPPEPEPNPKSEIENPKSSAADAPHRPSRRGHNQLPPEQSSPLSFDELTPEIVAARAAAGHPLPPNLIQYAQEHGQLWPRADAEGSKPLFGAGLQTPPNQPHSASAASPPNSTPPVEDCSAPDTDPASGAAPPAASAAETEAAATACDNPSSRPSDASTDDGAASQPLLIGATELAVTQLQITPDHPGASVLPAENMISARSAVSPIPHPLAR